MKEFKPSVFQKEVFLKMKNSPKTMQLNVWPRRSHTIRFIGLDLVAPGSIDKNIMTVIERKPAKKDTIIFMDEVSNWPVWYHQPVLWWKLRKLGKSIIKQAKANPDKIKISSTPKGNNNIYERFK